MSATYFKITYECPVQRKTITDTGFLTQEDAQNAIKYLMECYFDVDIYEFHAIPLDEELILLPEEICEKFMRGEY